MRNLEIYLLKLLQKLRVLKYFNFVFTAKVNNNKVKIPIYGSVGLYNMLIQPEWLDLLIEKYSLKNDQSIFVDVGVNIGQTLLRLKTINPEMAYLGFEPNSTCTAYVQKLISINQFKDCTVQNVALSTGVGILQLEKAHDIDSRASVIQNLRPGCFSIKENVLAVDYQSFYLDKDISFIKIDVEGAEYEVLKGMEKAIEKHQPIITCEVLDSHNSEVLDYTQERATKLCELLKSWNYSIIRLQTNSTAIVNYEKIDTIKIRQWTEESYGLNDYLFYPTNQGNNVIEKLRMIIHN